MAYKIRLLGKLVTVWQHGTTVKDKQTGHTHICIQTRVHPKGQLREKLFHVTLLLQYQIILHSQMNQSSTVSPQTQ